jgi:two-component system, NarL family, sensor kinase
MPVARSSSALPTAEAGPMWIRLVDAADPGSARRRPPSVRRVLMRFVVANVLVAALLLAASLWAGNRAARHESLADARATTNLLASLLIEPHLSSGVLTGDPDAIAELDAVAEGELRDAAVVRIKIWDAGSTIVYSDDPRLIGRHFPQGEEKQDILRNGGMLAELSSLREQENVFENPPDGQLLEVYRQVTTLSGDHLLLETYYRYDQVTSRQAAVWLTFAPISAAVLLGMLLVQLPLARRMIRQVREGDQERLRLHARAADASTEERRRIAGTLHDGVVQDLSAAPLFMFRAQERLRHRPGADPEDHQVAQDLDVATAAVRQSVASLRSLLIAIYPPHLAQAGLPAALADLAARVQARGVRTELDVPDDLRLPPEAEALLFRVAQEALLNATRHAHADTVRITIHRRHRHTTMEIRDDGIGFDPATAPATGHIGLRVLTDLAEAAGASLDLATAPGKGTALRLRLALQA